MQAQISGMHEKKPAALTEEAIESYLQSVASQGRTKGTLANYRRSLSKFFQWLPGEKLLSQETVEAYRGHMIEDLHYTPNSINMNLTPINAILAYMGLWNYQVPMASLEKAEYQPEISRSEYLRLLSAAKQTNKEKVYLLIKVFATIGIQVQELPHVTVEAVRNRESCHLSKPGQAGFTNLALCAGGAAPIYRKRGHRYWPGFPHKGGQAHQQDHGDNHYPEPLPGCPCPRGKMQPTVPSQAVYENYGHHSNERRHDGADDVRPLAGAGTEHLWLGRCEKPCVSFGRLAGGQASMVCVSREDGQ